MDVNQVYQVMSFALAKNKQQGFFDPADFYTVINQAQRGYLDFLLGEYQRYQPYRPISVVEFGQNQRIRQSIAPLIYSAILAPNTISGIAAFPSDYEYADAMWGAGSYYNIKFVQQDRLASYLNDPIDPIATNPVYLIQYEGFHFFPATIGNTRLSYVRTPPSIVWGSILDSNGREVYSAANSQQPIWGETDMMQIIVRALALCGVNLQLGSVMQYASDIKNNGQ